ncbi:MAG: heme-binding protein [Cyanobacteria bacterium P01_G01_bin.67]
MILYLIISVLAVPLAFPAFSQKAIVQSNDISTELAMKATSVALQSCKNKQLQCIVTVVDSQGLLKSQIVMDGAFPHAIETSMRKARTAASRRQATHLLEEVTSTEPDIAMTFNAIGLTTLSGGVPIKVDGQVIGAIGISGAPGEDENGDDLDTVIVNEAIRAIEQDLVK